MAQNTILYRGKKRLNWKSARNTALFHFLVIAFGLIMIYPLVWMLMSSFKPGREIFQSGSLLPINWTLDNYIYGFKGISGYSFWVFLRNSMVLVVFVIVSNIFSCSVTAYAFSKLRFPLRGVWFSIMLGTMMLPMHVRLIPQYIVYNNLGWVNTYLLLIIPKVLATEGFFVFLMTQYMRGLPKDLDEAATIDGCNFYQHFGRVIFPLSVPVIITTSIFSFIWTWNDFFSQMIYLSEIKTFTATLALRQYVDSMGESYWGAMFAMSIISLIPLFVMFIGFQRYLVEGITAGSLKG